MLDTNHVNQAHNLPLADAKESNEIDEEFLVRLEGQEDPKNWSDIWRWYLTFVASILAFNTSFSSSAPSGVLPLITEQYGLSREVGTLTVSLYVAGFCFGPLLFGPLSEQIGRRPVFVFSLAIYTIFQIAGAVADNAASIMVFRFLSGVFSSAPLTNSGALISDVWDATTRGKGLAIFTLAPFAGPALGPAVAGFIAVSVHSETYAPWRWLYWVTSSLAGLCWIVTFVTLPETYAPVLLQKKAAMMRKTTGDERWWALMDRLPPVTPMQRVQKVLGKPFVVLFAEPMLIAITAYMSFVYGCLYLLFAAYPVIFTQGHGFNAGISGLMFLPIPVGGAISVFLYLHIFNPRYAAAAEKCAPAPVPPEFRLEMSCISGPLFAASFFWFAWTSGPSISYWAPMLSGGLLGFSLIWLFLGLSNYIIDAYLAVAASALAANMVIRAVFAAAFPLFANKMYVSLGPEWAASLLGFVALALTPIPFVLMKFGPVLRRKSKYCPTGKTPVLEKDAASRSTV